MRFRRAFIAFILTSLPALPAEPLALRDGEKFTFKVSWAVLPGAGEIKISVQNEPAFNEPRLRVITTTATRGVARMFFTFEARAESLFDPVAGRLVSLREWSAQEKKMKEHTVMFDYPGKQALYSTPDSTAPRPLPMPDGDPMDLITQLVQTRDWKLQLGEKRDALVLFNDDFYELTIHAARREEVRTALGTFQTLVLEPRMEKTEPKGMFKRGSSARVWIAQDDPRRLPVKLEVEFKVGRGVATLTHYEGPAPVKAATGAATGGALSSSSDAKNPRP